MERLPIGRRNNREATTVVDLAPNGVTLQAITLVMEVSSYTHAQLDAQNKFQEHSTEFLAVPGCGWLPNRFPVPTNW